MIKYREDMKCDECKEIINTLIKNADYISCIDFCKSAIHNIDSTITNINNSYRLWFLNFVISENKYRLKKLSEAIMYSKEAIKHATDIEYEIKCEWIIGLCYADLNKYEESTIKLNKCVEFYKSENRLDMAHSVNIIIAQVKNDEEIALEAIKYLESFIGSDENVFEIDYTYYLDEAYYCLGNIYQSKNNGLMAYKAYRKIKNKQNYEKGVY